MTHKTTKRTIITDLFFIRKFESHLTWTIDEGLPNSYDESMLELFMQILTSTTKLDLLKAKSANREWGRDSFKQWLSSQSQLLALYEQAERYVTKQDNLGEKVFSAFDENIDTPPKPIPPGLGAAPRSKSCWRCSEGSHPVSKCSVWNNASIDENKAFLVKAKRCFSCMQVIEGVHDAKKCTKNRKYLCGVHKNKKVMLV